LIDAAFSQVFPLYSKGMQLMFWHDYIFKKRFLKHLFFSSTHNDNPSYDNSTAMYEFILAGLEPGIFCYVGGSVDHYATPPGQHDYIYIF
jgi:hypothetical protein